jgi:hypothetical protein
MEFDPLQAKQLIEELFHITDSLHKMTRRPFTPDGHLVGSLGEVIAAHAYGLTLEPPSTKACDAIDREGRRIEIKATFGNRVAFRRHDADCEAHLCLVLRLKHDADFDEIYNGPMGPILEKLNVRALQSNGQRQITLAQLRALSVEVNKTDHREVIRRAS